MTRETIERCIAAWPEIKDKIVAYVAAHPVMPDGDALAVNTTAIAIHQLTGFDFTEDEFDAVKEGLIFAWAVGRMSAEAESEQIRHGTVILAANDLGVARGGDDD